MVYSHPPSSRAKLGYCVLRLLDVNSHAQVASYSPLGPLSIQAHNSGRPHLGPTLLEVGVDPGPAPPLTCCVILGGSLPISEHL